MTLFVPDVNVLVDAFRADTSSHEACSTWLHTALRTDRIGLADTILSGFMRIVTRPRIFAEPTPSALALEFTRRLTDAPRTEWLRQGPTSWASFETLVAADAGVRGNLVPDTHIAALCVANGATLATRDRGFGRFPGLRRVEPGETG